MKKGFLRMLAIGAIAVVATCSCGQKFTPLSDVQLNAKVDSIFNAQKDAKLTDLRAACDATVQAGVDAKVEALKSGETAGK